MWHTEGQGSRYFPSNRFTDVLSRLLLSLWDSHWAVGLQSQHLSSESYIKHMELHAAINKGGKNTYLFVLPATDCFLDNSSAAWIGLQNIWPLFLTIFCFTAVRRFHSFTNLSIWWRMLLSAAWQASSRNT